MKFFGNLGCFLVFGFEFFGLSVPDAAKFPGVEEGCPVDILGEFAQGLVFNGARASEFWLGGVVAFFVEGEFVSTGVHQTNGRFVFFVEAGSEFFVACVVLGDEFFTVFFAEQRGGGGHGSGGV